MTMMKRLMCLAILLCAGVMSAQAKNVGFISTGGAADPDIVDHLESAQGGGYTVTSLNPTSDNPGATQALADASDVVLISETIGSTSVSNGSVFHLLNHPVTIISWEAFMFDEAKMTGTTVFQDFGNTNRSSAPIEVQGPNLNIFNVDGSHPLAAGLSGTVNVYNDEPPRSVSYGIPGPDADVVATADAAGNYPTLFRYEAGDQLADGSIAPGIRIGFFFGQLSTEAPNNVPPQFSNYNANALLLLDAAIVDAAANTRPLGLDFAWKSDNLGEWTDAGNWTPNGGPPGDSTQVSFSNHTATFGSAIMSNRTVSAETAVSVRAITFDNINTYSIAGSGSVNLIEGTVAGAPSITVDTGTHRFQARVNFHANTTVDIENDATLIFDGAANLMGHTLTKSGGGEMAIRNDFLTDGGTVNCEQGTCSGSGTISGDVNNNGGTISPGNSALLSDGSHSIVPEPSSFLLVLLAMIVLTGLGFVPRGYFFSNNSKI